MPKYLNGKRVKETGNYKVKTDFFYRLEFQGISKTPLKYQ
jgi:hypothetical protein